MTNNRHSTVRIAGPAASQSRRHLLRTLLSAALAPAALAAVNSSPAAAASGRIEFRLARAGFIVGVSGGSGSLFFQGKRYRLRVSGVSLGATIGAATVDFVGRAKNLRRASDVEGSYSSIGAGVAAAGGGAVARLRNSRGVELEVSGKQIGLMASVDLSGLRIRLSS